MLNVDKIILNKYGNKAEASVYISDEKGCELILNKFIVDITNGANPVGIVKHDGTPVFGGNVINGLVDLILEIFDSIKDYQVGTFCYDGSEVYKL